MKTVRFLASLVIAAGACAFFSAASADYGIYYGTSQTYANKTFKLSPVIVQPYNLALYAKYSGPKICYLSAGEFDGTSAELGALGLSGAVTGFNADWNSYVMDMGNPAWLGHVLSEESKLKSAGCSGVFLDTLWQSGQEDSAVALVAAVRSNWPSAFVAVNSAHDFKYRVKDFVDAYMFENFWTSGTKASSMDGQWYLAQFAEYSDLKKVYGKKLYALSYGNPFVKTAWAKTVKSYANAYGFDLLFANSNLTTIYGYLDSRTNSILKP